MGWKAIRDHYRVEHLVQVTSDGICIGSPYVHDIIVVKDGERDRLKDGYGVRRNLSGDLGRIVAEMDADPFKLAELALCQDVFEQSILVYTWEGGGVIEKRCEELGWPNVTHDGLLMYENRFSPDPGLVRTWAIDDAEAGIRWRRELVAEHETKLAEVKARLAQRMADLANLQSTSTEGTL